MKTELFVIVLGKSKNSWWTLQVMFALLIILKDDRAVMLALHCSVINDFSSLGKTLLFQVLQTKESQSSITTEMFVHVILSDYKKCLLESIQ